MSQHRSSSGSMSTPPRTYGLKSVLLAMLVFALGGVGCWYFYSRLERANDAIAKVREKTDEEIRQVKEDQDVRDQENARSREKDRQASVARIDELMTELKDLRSQASRESVAMDQNSGRAEELRYLGKKIVAALGDLEKEYTDWKQKLSNLEANNDASGQRIAANAETVASFIAISSGEPVDTERLAMWETQAKARLKTIAKLGDAPADVAPADLADVKAFAAMIESALDQLREQRTRLTALEKSVQDIQPGSDATTLEEAVAAHHNRITMTLVERAAAEAGDLPNEYVKVLADEQKKTQEAITKAAVEAERQQRALTLQLKQIESAKVNQMIEDLRRQEQQRKEEIIARHQRELIEQKYAAVRPQIERYLVPFITPGNKQLNGTKWVYSDKKVPLSLSGLQASHALANDELGYQRLYYIAGGRVNDRPNGMFEQYIGGQIHDRQIPLVRKAQTLLSEFGELMVQKGHLVP